MLAICEVVSVVVTIICMALAIKFCIGGPIFLPRSKPKKEKVEVSSVKTEGSTNVVEKLSIRARKLWDKYALDDLERGKKKA